MFFLCLHLRSNGRSNKMMIWLPNKATPQNTTTFRKSFTLETRRSRPDDHSNVMPNLVLSQERSCLVLEVRDGQIDTTFILPMTCGRDLYLTLALLASGHFRLTAETGSLQKRALGGGTDDPQRPGALMTLHRAWRWKLPMPNEITQMAGELSVTPVPTLEPTLPTMSF